MTSTTETNRSEATRRRGLSRLELIAGGVYVVVLLVLLALEPDILQAPFESTRAIVVTFGGALLAVGALLVMIRLGVPPIVRVLVIGIPVVLVSWWLLEPFFVDDRVDEKFSTSIAAAQRAQPSTTTPTTTSAPGAAAPQTTAPPAPTAPAGPQLLGSGRFVGLAGHDGTGDAGIFRLENGALVLRLENLDIDNGPDLELYLVPGAESYSPGDGSLHLGALKGNVGNQTYDLPAGFELSPGPWTVLVWCEAFTVEFVGASLEVA
jgi:Electron transfer DM13